ncbi:MarR family winged helix-turn-helix transcriptional regulator [Streptomyces sp. CG1]|uniref:MarR family winged helix-turn-helix transcriptional regulator n=1 Tax=Streptomyces sp. CG1 TaxID=1287523 RepID=UPI0034E1CCBD
MDSESPLAELLCFDLYAASRSVTSVYRVLLEPLGLTYPQYLVMLVLWRKRETSVGELATDLQLDYNTLSPLLKRLEARGLLERRRRPDDERSVSITLTSEGQAMSGLAAHIPQAIGDAMGLDGDAITELQAGLRKITANSAAYTARRAAPDRTASP